MDGIDLVAVEFDNDNRALLKHQQYTPYPANLRERLDSMAQNPDALISDMCKLDTRLGQFLADEVNHFLSDFKIDINKVVALGSHGQTLRHSIKGNFPYTLQITDPNIVAARTGLTVVADFRRRDIALGGHGAPLAPAFHHKMFHSERCNRAIINIGGIANITSLPADPDIPILGFDSGPGNTLLDALSRSILEENYDEDGNFARSGEIQSDYIHLILGQEPYFQLPAPKSTGTDYFSLSWLNQFRQPLMLPADAMASVTEITAISIAQAIKGLSLAVDECYFCGGGTHNGYLMERLAHHLSGIPTYTTSRLGIGPDWIEAMAFAWLAKQTLDHQPGNMPSVTSAEKFTILGGVYFSNGQI